MSRQRAEAWAETLGRELVTTEPAVHAALTAISGGLDEMRAMAGLVQHLSKVVQIYQARELKELREQPPPMLVLSREELAARYPQPTGEVYVDYVDPTGRDS